MRETGKRYTDDFKKMIVEVYNTGKPIKEICEEYGVNHVTVNNWINKANGGARKISQKPLIKISKEDKKAVKDAENEILRLKRVYGAPKIQKELEGKGHKVSVKRVQRKMKELGIRSIVTKKFRPTRSSQKVDEKPNLLNQDFSADKPNKKWVGDITYIHTVKHGWCYLAAVLDLCTKKIVGYSFGRTMDAKLVVAALDNAYVNQRPEKGVVTFHSDIGRQYTSKDFIKRLKKYKMLQSHSRKGCPYDNACIESFNSILKKERVNHIKYYDYESARIDIFQFIEAWYNRKRIHGSIGYITPQMKEDQFKKFS